jgi:PAS domain S-box-containing protein
MSVSGFQQSRLDEIFTILKQSQHLQNLFLDTTQDGLWIMDLSTSEGWINPQFWLKLGHTEAYVSSLENGWQDLIHPEDLPNVWRIIEQQSRMPDKFFEIIVRYLKSNQEFEWVRCRGSVIKKSGSPTKIVGSHSFINELRQNEELLMLCNHEAKIGFWYYIVEQQELFWSIETKNIHGVALDYTPIVEEAIRFYKEGENRERILSHFSASLEKGTSFNDELIIVNTSGEEKWIRTIGVPSFKNGKCISVLGTFHDIDAFKKEKEALRISQENLNTLIQTISDIVYEIDNHGNILFISNNWTKNLGYSIEESINTNISSIVHPDDLYKVQKVMDSMSDDTQEDKAILLRLKHQDGEWLWFRKAGRKIMNQNGEFLGLRGIMSEVTEWKKAQSELQRTKDFLYKTSEVASVGGWEYNALTKEFYWTEILNEIHELTPDMTPSFPLMYSFYDEESRQKLDKAYDIAIEKESSFDFDLKFTSPKGNVKWVRGYGFSVFENGKVARIYGIIQDITERKQLTLKIQNTNQQLQSIFNEMTEVVWSVSLPDYKMIFVTPSIEKLYGIPVEHCMRNSFHWTWVIHPEDKLVVETILDKLHNEGHYSEVYRIITQNGSVKWVENSGRLIYENGVPVRADGLTIDRTKRILAERQLTEELDLQNVLLNISSNFINCDLKEIDVIINKALLDVGEYMQADRSYIFQYDNENRTATNTYEWCREGISSEMDNLKDIPLDFFPEWNEIHKQNKPYIIDNINLMPESQRELQEGLQAQGIKSLIAFPLLYQGILEGFVGFDYVTSYHEQVHKQNKLMFLFAQLIINVFDRKKRNQQLLNQEEKYRNIITNMKLGILEVDTSDTIIFANNSFCEMSGYDVSELIGKDASKIFLDSDQAQEMKNRVDVRRKGISNSYEICVMNSKGEERWWFVSGAPNYNDKGELTGSVGIHLDITEKRNLEKELEYNEAIFKALFESSPIGIALNDYETGRFITVNDKLLESSGYEREEYLEKNIFQLTPSKFHRKELKVIEELAEKEKYEPYKKELFRKDGSVYPVELRGVVVNDMEQKKRVWSFVEDITEKQKLENDLIRESNMRKQIAEDLNELREKSKEELYQDLHDGVNQLLFAAKLGIQNSDVKNDSNLDYALDCLTKAIEEIRKIAVESTSQFVTESSFDEAISDYLLKMNTFTEMQIFIDNCIMEPLPMSDKMKKHLFRICQEITQNAMKHSGGTRLEFRFKAEDGDIIIIAKDNGSGVPAHIEKGIGVRSIQDRVYLLNGHIRFLNFINKGLAVYIRVKIQ